MSAAASKRVPPASPNTPAGGPAAIRLVTAVQYPLIRAGIRELVAGDDAITIVGETESASALPELAQKTGADVALVCYRLPGTGFSEIVRQLREVNPRTAVMLMSLRFSAELGLEALQLGAAGYVANDCPMTGILAAIRTVGSGGRQISPEVAELLAAEFARPNSARTRRLSPRESAVLGGIVKGRSHKEIAAELDVSAKSIGTYRSRVLRKLGLRTTADLVRYAVRRES